MAFSRRQRYSAWDGSQQTPWDADEVMKALADDLIEYGDLRWAMRNLMSRGMQIPQGGYMQGLRDMIRQLKEQKQRQLKRFNLDSIFEESHLVSDDGDTVTMDFELPDPGVGEHMRDALAQTELYKLFSSVAEGIFFTVFGRTVTRLLDGDTLEPPGGDD